MFVPRPAFRNKSCGPQSFNFTTQPRITISPPRADAVGLREGTILNSVEGGEEKTSVEVKPHCYLNSREIRLPRTPARREA